MPKLFYYNPMSWNSKRAPTFILPKYMAMFCHDIDRHIQDSSSKELFKFESPFMIMIVMEIEKSPPPKIENMIFRQFLEFLDHIFLFSWKIGSSGTHPPLSLFSRGQSWEKCWGVPQAEIQREHPLLSSQNIWPCFAMI